MAIKFSKNYANQDEFINDYVQQLDLYDRDMQNALGNDYSYLLSVIGDSKSPNFNLETYSKFKNPESKFNYLYHSYLGDSENAEEYSKITEEFNQLAEYETTQKIYESLNGFQKTLSTVGGITGNALNALYGTIENISDLVTGLTGAGIKALGGGDELLKFTEKDITGTGSLQKALDDFNNKYTFINKSWLADIANGVASGLARLSPVIFTGGLGAVNTVASTAYWLGMAGGGVTEYIDQKGVKNVNPLGLLGYTSGNLVIEFVSEKLFGDVVFGKGIINGLGGASKKSLGILLQQSVGEGFEEGIAEVFGYILKSSMGFKDAEGNPIEFKIEDVINAVVIGGLIGSITTGSKLALTKPLTGMTKGETFWFQTQMSEIGVKNLQKDYVSELKAKYPNIDTEVELQKLHPDEYNKAVEKQTKLERNIAEKGLALSKFAQEIGAVSFAKGVELLNMTLDRRAEVVRQLSGVNRQVLNDTAKQDIEVLKKTHPGVDFILNTSPTNEVKKLANKIEKLYGVKTYIGDVLNTDTSTNIDGFTVSGKNVFINQNVFNDNSYNFILELAKHELSHTLQRNKGVMDNKSLNRIAGVINKNAGYELIKGIKAQDNIIEYSEAQADQISKALLFDKFTAGEVWGKDKGMFTKTVKWLMNVIKNQNTNTEKGKLTFIQAQKALNNLNDAISEKSGGNPVDIADIETLLPEASPSFFKRIKEKVDINYSKAHFLHVKTNFSDNANLRMNTLNKLELSRIDGIDTKFDFKTAFNPDQYTKSFLEEIDNYEGKNFKTKMNNYLIDTFGVVINDNMGEMYTVLDYNDIIKEDILSELYSIKPDFDDIMNLNIDGLNKEYFKIQQLFDSINEQGLSSLFKDEFFSQNNQRDGLDSVKLVFDTFSGYDPNTRELHMSAYTDTFANDLFHEITHVISHIDGLTNGSSPDSIKNSLLKLQNKDLKFLIDNMLYNADKINVDDYSQSDRLQILLDHLAYRIYTILDGEFNADLYGEKALPYGSHSNISGFYSQDGFIKGYGRFKDINLEITTKANRGYVPVLNEFNDDLFVSDDQIVNFHKTLKKNKQVKRWNNFIVSNDVTNFNNKFVGKKLTDEMVMTEIDRGFSNNFNNIFDTTDENTKTKILDDMISQLTVGNDNIKTFEDVKNFIEMSDVILHIMTLLDSKDIVKNLNEELSLKDLNKIFDENKHMFDKNIRSSDGEIIGTISDIRAEIVVNDAIDGDIKLEIMEAINDVEGNKNGLVRYIITNDYKNTMNEFRELERQIRNRNLNRETSSSTKGVNNYLFTRYLMTQDLPKDVLNTMDLMFESEMKNRFDIEKETYDDESTDPDTRLDREYLTEDEYTKDTKEFKYDKLKIDERIALADSIEADSNTYENIFNILKEVTGVELTVDGVLSDLTDKMVLNARESSVKNTTRNIKKLNGLLIEHKTKLQKNLSFETYVLLENIVKSLKDKNTLTTEQLIELNDFIVKTNENIRNSNFNDIKTDDSINEMFNKIQANKVKNESFKKLKEIRKEQLKDGEVKRYKVYNDVDSEVSSAVEVQQNTDTKEMTETKESMGIENDATPIEDTLQTNTMSEIKTVEKTVKEVKNISAEKKAQLAKLINTTYERQRKGNIKGLVGENAVNDVRGYGEFSDKNSDFIDNLTEVEFNEIFEVFKDSDYMHLTRSQRDNIGFMFMTIWALNKNNFSIETVSKLESVVKSILSPSGTNMSFKAQVDALVGEVRLVDHAMKKFKDEYGLDLKVRKDMSKEYRHAVKNNDYIKIAEIRDELLLNIGQSMKEDTTDNFLAKDISFEERKKRAMRVLDKINSFRMTAMLSSPATWFRNILSNHVLNVMNIISDKIAGKIEEAWFTDLDGKQYRYQPNKHRDNYSTFVKDYVAKTLVNNGKVDLFIKEGKYDNLSDNVFNKAIYENRYKNKWLNKYNNLIRDYLDKSDKVQVRKQIIKNFEDVLEANYDKFSKTLDQYEAELIEEINKRTDTLYDIETIKTEYTADYNNMLEQYNNGDNLGNLNKWQLNDLLYDASNRALDTFLRSQSNLNKTLQNLANRNMAFKIILNTITPFTKIGINVTKTFMKYSPVNLAVQLGKMIGVNKGVLDIRGDVFAKAKISKGVAQGAVGTALYIIGALLASLNLVGFDEDKKSNGIVLDIAGLKFRFSDIAPGAVPLMMGAGMVDISKSHPNWFANITEIFIDQSFLNSYENLFAYTSSIADIPELLFEQYVQQYVPAVLRNISKTIDPNTKDFSGSKSLLKLLMSGIPFLSLAVADKPDPYSGGTDTIWANYILNLINNVSPLKMDYKKRSAIQVEAERVGAGTTGGTGRFTINGSSYKLSGKEKETFNKKRGEYVNSELNKLFNSSEYKKSTDEDKKKMIENVYSKATEISKINYWTSQGNYYVVTDRKQLSEYSKYLDNKSKLVFRVKFGGSKFIKK